MENILAPKPQLACGLLLLVGLLVGCDASSPTPARPARGLQAQLVCIRDACTSCREREQDRARTCTECVSFCAGATLPDCFSYCRDLCNPDESCDAICDAPSTCYEQAVSFQPYGDPDPELEAACLRAYAHQTACGVTLADASLECRRFATLEDPSTAMASYDCVSALPCGASVDAQRACLPRAHHGLADGYCQLAAERGTSCDEALRARLADADGFMLATSARAIDACAAPDASAIGLDDCVRAWLLAVEPSSATP